MTLKASTDKKQGKGIVGKVVLYAIVFLTLLLTFSYHWTTREFGNIGFAEIIFTLNMPLQGTSSTFIVSYLLGALLPAVLLTAALVVLIALLHRWLKKKKPLLWGKWCEKRGVRGAAWALVIAVWLGGLSYNAEGTFGFLSYFKSLTQQSSFIAEEYVSPADVKLTFPEKKRNLIYIFLESAETSAQDVASGGLMEENYIPEMTELAKENVSFSQSDLIEGASVAPLCGWTMAGMVAQTAGLPLKLFRTSDGNFGASSAEPIELENNAEGTVSLAQNELDKGDDNIMEKYPDFLPGAVALGDILKENGYHNVFMAGSDFVFGGRTNYCRQHGDYEILDYYVARRRKVIRPGYKVWWGFEDEILYRWARDELTKLSEADEPFNFSMITVDTHHQDGYVCNLCQDRYAEQYANVWRCASEQVTAFVDWCKQQPFYENTTIVIAGDHCSMDSDFYKEYTYDKHNGETVRKTYNVFINSAVQPVREKNRLFTTLDMFPSTLAALGVQIEGERLGLGTNLFSDAPTLPEKYGYEIMFEELRKKSLFYDNEILYPKK